MSTLVRLVIATLTLIAGCPFLAVETNSRGRLIFVGDREDCPCPTTTSTLPPRP